MPLDKNAILNADDRRIEPLNVPEWGGQVFVRTLKASERDAWEISLSKDGKNIDRRNARAKFASLVLCDEKGVRLFSDAEVGALGEKSAAALTRVWDAGTRLNGIGEETVQELEKNSGATIGDGSSSV